jgi:phospholipase D-like protein
MGRVYVGLFFACLIVAMVALISCLSAEDGELRRLPRAVWVLVILFFPLVGSISYLTYGRPVPAGPRRSIWTFGGLPPDGRQGGTVAPDDDPEFLRRLGKTLDNKALDNKSERDADRLRRWEEDLRRREEDLRRRDKRRPGAPDDAPPADS